MLRFKNLGSGSTGNATVVEGRSGSSISRLLIDCGFGIRQLQARLALAGLLPEDLDAVFITHEHSDHVGCAQALAVRYGIPVWMSAGTYAAVGSPDLGGWLRVARDMEAIDLATFSAQPFTVPHDAREPLQLRCSDGSVHLGVMTDLGHASEHVLRQLEGCHALMIEANHDPELLAASSYPAFLKRRVGGRFGHLANAASADILRAVMHPGLRCVVAAHLSARNNAPELAQQALAAALGWNAAQVLVASPSSGTDWHEVC
ncbi:MAG: MBL fold metallo-hydrolase [Gammaproteobacteria bacterium]|nr:MBL fold metallo-hydrolase [Gammaproteobacteria bacterium]MBU2121130.1 MBL fold metallo-hydrolase [Gammaproteobacteria bacterium]MBU2170154.1 MBL fold metallo-hydrolase [Gammaproteobacteria bacterium]MBU2202715.1 MBL fold metallo-hydrolase [Gammaproteobacteria bacterium]MBU2276454.1 MBL fold metallo-hydrolase [Gammaproteobacteria bacterium]